MDADLSDTDTAPTPITQTFFYFPAAVCAAEKPEFLPDVSAACEDALAKRREEVPVLDEIYPVHMTGNLLGDPRVEAFSGYVIQIAEQMLREQGYNTAAFNLAFSEMWCQEHHKHSAMEQHTHGNGVQVVGFYFLNAPENASRPVFHDPKSAKVQISLPENNPAEATFASNLINFEPKAGQMLLTNAWLPHSFTRHANEEPIRFVHFNLGPVFLPYGGSPPCRPPAEII